MNTKAAEAFARARSNLLLDHFFFGRLALYLKPVQKEDIPTLAVDGKHLFYNPQFFLDLPRPLQKSAIAHEVMHCVMQHILRRKGRDQKLWNRACDYAENRVLQDSGFKLGENWLYSKAFDGMNAEEIYDILKQEQNDGDGSGNGGQGEALCDVMDAADGGSDADLTSTKQEWAINVAQVAMEAKRHGALPASMERFVEELTANKVPWREVLQRFVSERAKDDYSWARPNRMFVAAGAYLPAMYSENMGPIDVVIDTSGSITQELLNEFGSEIKAIVAAVRPARLRVIYADAAVNRVDTFEPGDEVEFHMVGGGGTDFRPAIALASEEPPVALVYLTDMYGPFPDQAPDFPVMWCATSGVEGPFGETVKLER